MIDGKATVGGQAEGHIDPTLLLVMEDLAWIAGAADVPGQCRCGRPNGRPKIKARAERSLERLRNYQPPAEQKAGRESE